LFRNSILKGNGTSNKDDSISEFVRNKIGTARFNVVLRFLPLAVFILAALFILRGILFSPGTIGLFHDWFLGPLPDMVSRYANDGNYIFGANGGYKVYPSDWFFRLLLSPFSGLGGEIVTKGMLFLFITLSGWSMFRLGKNLEIRYSFRIVMGVLYIFTPIIWTRTIAGHGYYLLAYAIAPLLIVYYLEATRAEKKTVQLRKALIAGILLAVMTTQLQFLVMGAFLLFILLIADVRRYKTNIKVFAVILLIAFVFQLPWILPLTQNQSTLANFAPDNLLYYHEITHSSSLLDSMRLMGYVSQSYSYQQMEIAGSIPIIIAYLAIIITIASMACLIFRRNRITLALALVMITGIFLSKGLSDPAPDIFIFLFKYTPLFIFRELWHIIFLVAFPAVILTTFLLQDLTTRVRLRWPKKDIRREIMTALPAVTIASLFLLSAGFPLLAGNFYGFVQTYDLNSDYVNTVNGFENDPGEYRVLWYPFMSPVIYSDLKLAGVDPFLQLSPKPTLPVEPSYGSPYGELSAFIGTELTKNGTTQLGSVLAPYGFKYVIVRDDFHSRYMYYQSAAGYPDILAKWNENNMTEIVSNQADLYEVGQGSTFTTYLNNKSGDMIIASSVLVHGSGDLSSLFPLSEMINLTSVGYISTPIQGIEKVGVYFTNDDPIDAISLVSGKTIDPGLFTSGADPTSTWIDAKKWFWYDSTFAETTHHGAFTLSDSTLVVPLKSTGDVHLMVKALYWPKGGEIGFSQDGVQFATLNTNSTSHYMKWVDLGVVNGSSPVTIISDQPSNYIDSILPISEDQIQQAYQTLQDVPLVHYFDSECLNNSKNLRNNQSELILKKGERASLDFNLVRNDSYRIMLDGGAGLTITVDGIARPLTLGDNGKYYAAPIYLNKGQHILRIIASSQSTVTGVCLYTNEGHQRILDVVGSNKIANITGSDVAFSADVELTSPSLVSLSMPYDGNWVLYANGQPIKSTHSYSVMNGFWINQTGSVHLEIKFLLQEQFNWGRAIALTVLAGVAIFVIVSRYREIRPGKERSS
jgi:hypothetical protein